MTERIIDKYNKNKCAAVDVPLTPLISGSFGAPMCPLFSFRNKGTFLQYNSQHYEHNHKKAYKTSTITFLMSAIITIFVVLHSFHFADFAALILRNPRPSRLECQCLVGLLHSPAGSCAAI
jgi:TctA family transporter